MSFDFKKEDIKYLRSIGIEIFPEDRNYWFVRTQKGTYYDDFVNDNFIGIEWDKISDLDRIKSMTENDLKEQVNKTYPEIEKPGYVSAQIYKFCNSMKSGDIVLIPSKNSRWITFGEILENDAYVYEPEKVDFQDILDEFFDSAKQKCEETLLIKRRRIKWIKSVRKSELDPYLYSIIYSHNAIVDAGSYSIFIDRMLSSFYIKGDEAYFTYKVNKKENIPYSDILSFLNNNNKLMDYINNQFNENIINKDEIVLKINVQSRGPIQIKGSVRNILLVGIVTGALFGVDMDISICGLKYSYKTEGLPQLISKVVETYDKIRDNKENDELKEIIKGLEQDKEKLQMEIPSLTEKED